MVIRTLLPIRNQCALVMAVGVLVNGCAYSDQPSTPLRESQSREMPKEYLNVQCVLESGYGGGITKNFERALARTYRPLKITLVAGKNAVSKVSAKDAASDHFLGGVESEAGKVIIRVLNEQKPWDWESVKGTMFANNLYFNGNVNGKAWKYVSVYPDTKLESLLVRLRKELERR